MPRGISASVAFITIALIGPPAFVVVTRLVFGISPPLATQVWLQIAYCALTMAFVWMAVGAGRLPLSSLGLRRPTLSTAVLAAVLLALTLFVLPALTSPLVDRLGSGRRDLAVRELAALPVWFRLMLAVTGGAIEETLYRGYAFGRLEAMTKSRWRAGVIVVVVFTLAHLPLWGVVYSLVAVLPFSVVMTAAYAWRRDLLANSTAHSLGLVVGLLRI
jgi:membrane protease YdiL (CAAX protease family)